MKFSVFALAALNSMAYADPITTLTNKESTLEAKMDPIELDDVVAIDSMSNRNLRGYGYGRRRNAQLSILSRNLYLGADISTLFDPANADKSIHEVIQTFNDLIRSTDYELRSAALAQEILDREPDVVCLQEVWNFGFSDFPDGNEVDVETDYLSILLEKIDHKYQVSAVNKISKGILPYEANPNYSTNPDDDTKWAVAEDSDVILIRKNLNGREKESGGNTFDTVLPLPIVSNRLSSTSGPVLNVLRGFTWSKIRVKKDYVLVVNTHLEQGGDPTFVQFQQAQAAQLLAEITVLVEEDSDVSYVVLAGDLNTDPAFGTGIYESLVDGRVDPFAGANLATFGTDPFLMAQVVGWRIDHIFVPGDVTVVSTEVFGTEPLESIGNIFPSDHFGIMCTIDLV